MQNGIFSPLKIKFLKFFSESFVVHWYAKCFKKGGPPKEKLEIVSRIKFVLLKVSSISQTVYLFLSQSLKMALSNLKELLKSGAAKFLHYKMFL